MPAPVLQSTQTAAEGIPALLSPENAPGATPALMTGDAPNLLSQAFTDKWGVYLNGLPVIVADSVLGFEFKASWRIADFPMEGGAFQSYNKIATPYDVRVKLARGGSDDDRQAFLSALEQATASLDLYDVVTPEKIYLSASIADYDYRRTSTEGAKLIVADVHLLEVRSTARADFSNTTAPSGASPVNAGIVQPQTPTPAQAAAVKARGATGSW